jgi:hypothetical protein
MPKWLADPLDELAVNDELELLGASPTVDVATVSRQQSSMAKAAVKMRINIVLTSDLNGENWSTLVAQHFHADYISRYATCIALPALSARGLGRDRRAATPLPSTLSPANLSDLKICLKG